MRRPGWSHVAFMLLLKAYPRDFRLRFSPELCAAFADELAEARSRGPIAGLGLWIRTVRDVTWLAAVERLAGLRGSEARDPAAGIRQRRGRTWWRGVSGGGPQPRRPNPADQVSADIRFALRGLRGNPTFAATAILTLALGIGASATVFAVVEAVLLTPLPYDEPERLVRLWETHPRMEGQMPISAANLIDWQQRSRSFAEVAAFNWSTFNLTGGNEPLLVTTQAVSENFFRLLGARPSIGRTFVSSDEDPGAPPVAVLSDRLWRGTFGGEPDIIGREIRLDDRPHEVIGVMPPEFVFHNPDSGEASLWTPGAITPQARANRAQRALQAIARLRPEVTVGAAQSEMDILAAALAEQYPQANRDPASNEGTGVAVVSLHEDLVARVRLSMFVLAGGVGFVLLIAWVNVTNLLLARTAARGRELALRASIGAGRRRIAQQLLTETTLLSVLGGLAGLALTRVLIAVFTAAAPAAGGALGLSTGAIPLLSRSVLGGGVLAMTLITAVITAAACGVAPALRAARSDPLEGLQTGCGPGAARRTGGSVLVAVEIALALVLLIGLGLLVRTMWRLSDIPLGFEPANAEIMRVQLTRDRYAGRESLAPDALAARRGWVLRPEYGALISDVVDRLERVPGVQAVGAVNRTPLHGPFSSNPSYGVSFEGVDRQPTAVLEGVPAHMTFLMTATPGYFEAMGIPLLEGRAFTDADDAAAPTVAIVNQEFVEWFGLEDPVGKRIMVRDGPWREVEIVGIVGDVFWFGYHHEFLRSGWYGFSLLYLPYAQPATAYRSVSFQMTANFVVRHDGNGDAVRAAMRDVFRGTDPQTPVAWVGSLDEYVGEGLSERRFHLLVIGSLAVVALILALVGVYGVMAFQVGQRVPEIGVRMALGAQTGRVVAMIVGEGARVAVLGVLMGVGGAMTTTRLLSQWLYEVSPTEPVLFAGLAAITIAVALLACWIPARHAARVNPVDSLRSE